MLLVSISLQLLGLLSVSGMFPLLFLLITALVVSAAGVMLVLSVFHFRMGEVVPAARGTVIDSMSDGVITVGPQNRIMDVNPVVEHLIGCPASKLVGQPVEEVWPGWLNQIGLSSNDQASREIVMNLEGTQRIYDVGISPLTDWRGDLVSQIVVLRDITERKQAEERLHESEEKFRGITERNFDAIYELDVEGRITYASPAVERITGYTPEEISGNSILKFNKSKIHEAAQLYKSGKR